MAMLSGLTVIGGGVACCGLLFFLGCVVLVVWYAVRGPRPVVSASAPEPVVQATVEHPTAAAPVAPAAPSAPAETPTADE